jgi:hypothetical protein
MRKNFNNKLNIRTNNSGYREYKDPSSGKWTLTHRTVAEKQLGGKIFKGHEVHHKNGNKLDNRPSNLQVLSKAAHKKIHYS